MKNRFQGSALITTLLFFFLFSFLFLTILEDFNMTQKFYFETKNFYVSKIMMQVFLTTEKEIVEQGEIPFSTGILYYSCEGESISMKIRVKERQYFFKELKISN